MKDTELRRRLYVPNFEHWKKICLQPYFSARELGVQTIEKGVILPARQRDEKNRYLCRGGVCDADLNFVVGYNNQSPDQKNGAYCLDEAYALERSELEQSNEEVIFGGILVCHFGHFLTDCLARMWYAVSHPNDRRKYVFIMLKTSNLQELKSWVYMMFDLLGVPEERLVILDKPTQFAKVIVPEQSVRIKYDFTKEFLYPFRYIMRRVRPFGIKKLFLTRGKELKSAMHLCNQEYFEAFFQARGFTVIAPETLSITDQIALVSGAEEIATFLGTLAHWSLFSRPGTKWTFINRVDNFVSRQCLINQATGVDWHFVSAAMNFLYAEQGGGVCLLGSTEHWKRYVLEYYGIQLDPTARIPLSVVNDYIERWCKYFANSIPRRIDSLKNLHRKIDALEAQLNDRH